MSEPTAGTILVVDDEPGIRHYLQRLLASEGYEVATAADGAEAVARVAQRPPDLILLDVMLPDIEGGTLCRRLKEDPVTEALPVMLMTALEIDGLRQRSKADVVLRKPFRRDEVTAWTRSLVAAYRARGDLQAVEEMLIAVAAMVETRSLHVEEHPRRVCSLGGQLATAAGLGRRDVEIIRKAALLHDVGLIGVPEAILQKPGPLSPDELEQVKRHSVLGARLCRPLRHGDEISAIVRAHHERWDGAGYPDRRAGEQIPIGARILALADAFDSCTSARAYRAAFTAADALEILWFGAGSQWDPGLVELFDSVLWSGLDRQRSGAR
ncbi:MAG: response regulator [Armatimonadota bacterium]|nr:response regulator [Armatimonadota bacterium]